MTQRELAESAGVSIPAVSKSKKLPTVYDADGRRVFDPADRNVQAFINLHSAKRNKATTKAEAKASPTPRPEKSKPSEPLPTSPILVSPRPLITTNQPGSYDLDDQKTAEQIEKLRLENARSRRDHVPVEEVRSVFMKFYSIHSAILVPLSAKSGKDIALALGYTDDASALKAEAILDEDVFGALQQIEATMQKWLGEAEVVK